MKYMLDTNICIYLIKKKPQKILDRFESLNIGDVAISVITYAELQYGVEKSQYREKNQLALANFLAPLEILPFTDKAALISGEVRAYLERQGKAIGPNDLLIAAQALSLNLTLVTNNAREFSRIRDLKLENWME